ncbi:hypothetical protein L1987_44341 [Smallanthus sonchifolius]|uniref:Uncharacterized protein n=1 Tax=Smallanthus sonchifolius TaxID=185202 RepID=A0ACB9GPU3_9ASTR|nr:hypothetical protein L1987_44341 [Smallanthus sonchifolius]
MSTMIPSFTCVVVQPRLQEHRVRSWLEIRAQSLGDQGRSSNLVDSSMKILKDRIEVIRTKERLERRSKPYGWDYDSNYISKHKKQPEYTNTPALICGTLSLSVLTGTALLHIFSVIAHLNL